MMAIEFTPAADVEGYVKLALAGGAGTGKTYSALLIAGALGTRIAVRDSEAGSASKYAGAEGMPAFDQISPRTHTLQSYIDCIDVAEKAGYEVLIIDSLSHAWAGAGGALEQVDKAALRAKGNTYVAWGEVTPLQNKLMMRIIECPMHVIATLRSKTAYDLVKQKNGKTAPVKIGMAPIQREGVDFEFDVMGTMNTEHQLLIEKSRCPAVDGEVIDRPGADFGEVLREWAALGAKVEPETEPASAGPAPDLAVPYGADAELMCTSDDEWKRALFDRAIVRVSKGGAKPTKRLVIDMVHAFIKASKYDDTESVPGVDRVAVLDELTSWGVEG